MNRVPNQRTSVSTLLGATIFRAEGGPFGRVREFAVAPLVDASKVEALVVQAVGVGRRARRSLVPLASLQMGRDGRLELTSGTQIGPMPKHDDFLMLERDLLDQQIIDVHGHKVVRVNDVELVWECGNTDGPALTLKIAEVEVGTRGALRRLLKGLPAGVVERVSCRVRPTVIPWDFVDLIDRDPSRRVRLKIEQDKLARMHPSDLADILEELAPAEREALFSSLDEEVAAEALEEVEPRTKKTLVESMNSEQIAGILEEMDPGAAADLLSELSDERSDAILEEMGEQERHDVEELLEFASDSAAGLMTTDYVAVGEGGTVADAMQSLKEFEGDLESVTEVFVVTGEGHLHAAIPVTRLVLEDAGRPLAEVEVGYLVTTGLNANGKRVAELFDKYNLRSLAVLDEHGQLAGVIRPEHVIAWLRGEAMKILYAGELRPGTSCLFRSWALERLGHQVIGLDPTPYVLENRLLQKVAFRAALGPHARRLNADILAAAEREQPDIFWADKLLLLTPQTLKSLRTMGITSVSYMIDNAFGPRRDPGWRMYRRDIPEFDLHVTQREVSFKDYLDRGAQHVMKVQTAYEPTIHYPSPVPVTDAERTREVSFVGTPYDDRGEILTQLAEAGLPVIVSGNPRQWKRALSETAYEKIFRFGELYEAEYREAIWRSKINLSFLTKANQDEYTHKSFEIAGCGGFLMAERCRGHEEKFKEGEEAVFFTDTADLIAKIRRWLPDESGRARIAAAGQDRAVRDGYSNDVQMQRIVEKLAQIRRESGRHAA